MSNYAIGQLVEMKKGHPCGANCWRIIRIGMDIRIKCLKCGRSVLIPRGYFERRMKRLIDENDSDSG
jgi:hypothetical protein